MLHFGGEYNLNGTGLALGIPCLRYVADIKVENIEAEFTVYYDWSGIYIINF